MLLPNSYAISTPFLPNVFCFWITLRSTVAFVTFATFDRSFSVSRIILAMNPHNVCYDGTVIRAAPRVSALVFSKSITSALQRGSAFMNSTSKHKRTQEPFPRRAIATSWSYTYCLRCPSSDVQVPRSSFPKRLRLNENGALSMISRKRLVFGWGHFSLFYSPTR